MALIKCTECGKRFSDKANSCPNCACPIELIKKNTKSGDVNNNDEVTIGSIGSMMGKLFDNKMKDMKDSFNEIKTNIKDNIDETKENVQSYIDKASNDVKLKIDNKNNMIGDKGSNKKVVKKNSSKSIEEERDTLKIEKRTSVQEKIVDKVEQKKLGAHNNKCFFDKKILLVILGIALLLVIIKPTRIITIGALILVLLVIYFFSIFVDSNIIENKYNFSRKELIFAFSICFLVITLGIILNFVDPREKIEYVIIDRKDEIKDTVKKDGIIENNNGTNTEKEENNEETSTKDENENEKKIIMIALPSDYVGNNYKEVVQQLKDLGYTNIVTVPKETNDTKMENDTIAEFTIKGSSYESGDEFSPTDELRIVYWQVKEEQKKEDKIVYPKDGSKLAEDLDEESLEPGKNRYYYNVDGVKNIPKLQKYEKTYVTDSVYEYIKYLKDLGYKVEITKYENKEPYKGFHTYDVTFKVSKDGFSWTMYTGIQDEKYIEYDLEIVLE